MFTYNRPTHLPTIAPTDESTHIISVILWMSFTDKYLQIWSLKTCLWVFGSRCSSLSGKVLQQHINQTVICATNLNHWFLKRDIIKLLQFVVTHLNNKINSTVFHVHTKVQGTKETIFRSAIQARSYCEVLTKKWTFYVILQLRFTQKCSQETLPD